MNLWAEQGIAGRPSLERGFCAIGDMNIRALAVAVDSRSIASAVIVDNEVVHLLVTIVFGFIILEIRPKQII
jgi:hypothetical protein